MSALEQCSRGPSCSYHCEPSIGCRKRLLVAAQCCLQCTLVDARCTSVCLGSGSRLLVAACKLTGAALHQPLCEGRHCKHKQVHPKLPQSMAFCLKSCCHDDNLQCTEFLATPCRACAVPHGGLHSNAQHACFHLHPVLVCLHVGVHLRLGSGVSCVADHHRLHHVFADPNGSHVSHQHNHGVTIQENTAGDCHTTPLQCHHSCMVSHQRHRPAGL